MIWELLLVAAALVALTVFLAAGLPSRRGWALWLMAALAAWAAWRGLVWNDASLPAYQLRQHLAAETPTISTDDGYVGAAACKACHPGEFTSWHKSYHRTMTQMALPGNVVGDFHDVRVTERGMDYLMERRGDEFWAKLAPHGTSLEKSPLADAQMVMTTGAHHYQLYWNSVGPDKTLIIFPLAYLKEAKRWIPREAALCMPPGMQQSAVVWSGICIRCHSTHGEPRIDAATGGMETQVAELGISCESCHGPGRDHVAANRNPARRYGLHVGSEADPTIVQPAKLSAARSSQVCGQCHAISSYGARDNWHGAWNRFRPGHELGDVQTVVRPLKAESLKDIQAQLKQDPEFLRGRFWSDGEVRVSGREYNGLLESKCFQGGSLSCLSCHSMHHSDPNDQLAADMHTDKACLQCHEKLGADVAAHTHHAVGSEGSSCYNCHMPHTNYGLLKAIRSHRITSPTVAASVNTGRPNACNQCHLDRSLGWTQERLQEWYGTKPVELSGVQQEISAMATWLLQGDAGQRALAAWSMGWQPAHKASGDDWLAPYLATLLDDPYDAVRYIAQRSLRGVPGQEKVAYDFLAAPEARQAVRERVLADWQRSYLAQPGKVGRNVLIGSDGKLDLEALQRLLKQRDDRPVDLQE